MQAPSPPKDLKDSRSQRQTMVDCQIRTYDVTDPLLIDRMLIVPREHFVPDDVRDLAYSDIGFTVPPAAFDDEPRYLLAPLVLARLIQGGRVKATDRVLDVACGTGYSTAVLAGLAAKVVALEESVALCADLRTRLAGFGLACVDVEHGALAAGVAAAAPFDVILINGAVETNLDALLGQLGEGGRLLMIRRGAADPTGRAAKAICLEKRGGEVGTRTLFDASAPILRAFHKAPQFVF